MVMARMKRTSQGVLCRAPTSVVPKNPAAICLRECSLKLWNVSGHSPNTSWMSNTNKAELIGFLGLDAETKTTANGKAVTNLSLATKTSYLKDGERQQRTEWHRVQTWGRL